MEERHSFLATVVIAPAGGGIQRLQQQPARACACS